MAGQILTSRVARKSNAGWPNKALSAATTVGHGIAAANDIREALPVIGGVARAAAGYFIMLAAAGAPVGL